VPPHLTEGAAQAPRYGWPHDTRAPIIPSQGKGEASAKHKGAWILEGDSQQRSTPQSPLHQMPLSSLTTV